MKKILVIGGTGMLGKPVATRLKKDGFDVVIFTRNAVDARIKMPSNFEIIEGNVNNAESLKSAMIGIDGVHINLKGGTGSKNQKKAQWLGTENIVKVAKENRIERITLITGATVREENRWFKDIKYKLLAEQAVQNSGIPYVIFRPTWFMETLPNFFKNGKAFIPGNNTNAYPWLCADDYAQLVSKAMMTNVADNNILPVAGPKRYTMEEAITKYGRSIHPDMVPQKIPLGVMKIIGTITFNFQMKNTASLLSYFEKVKEDNNMEITSGLLGKPETTLDQWLESKLK